MEFDAPAICCGEKINAVHAKENQNSTILLTDGMIQSIRNAASADKRFAASSKNAAKIDWVHSVLALVRGREEQACAE